MKWERSDLTVGLVIVTAALITMGSFAWLSTTTNAYPLYTEFDRIDGIARQGQVMLRGYTVGSVESIAPRMTDDGLRFRVRLNIHARLASGDSLLLPEGTVARLVPPPVIGAGMVVLEPPRDGGPPLAPGSFIPGVRTAAVLEQVQGLTVDLTGEAVSTMATARLLMDSLAVALAMTTRALTEATSALPGLLAGLERQLTTTEALTADVHAQFATLAPSLQASVDSAAFLMTHSRRLVEDLHRSIETSTPEIENILANLDTTTIFLSHFVREVSLRPWRLFSGVRPPLGLDQGAGQAKPETPTTRRP
jgi:ABC-type transporter Mla subunit MlaD